MLGRFPGANKNDWNIPAIALLQHGIGIYIHFMESGAKLSQERGDGRLGFVTEMASWPRVKRNVAGTASGKTDVFWMGAHRFIAKAHLTGEQTLLGRTSA